MDTQTIGLFEAKAHLSELVARAEKGGEVIITRHNKPVARIVPMEVAPAFDFEKRRAAVEGMRKIARDMARKHGPITTDEIVQWVREGRDDRSDRILKAAVEKK